jgi:phosphatidylinositol alpha-1,6-mannosyltransferase
MPRPALAAITLDETGGGVAAVSRLIWQVMGDTCGASRQLIALGRPRSSDRPSRGQRVEFGLRLASQQLAHPDSWVFFTHLSLARATSVMPAVVRRPYAVFLHGIEAWRPLGSRERAVLRGAALRVANSRYTAQHVLAVNPDIGPIEICPLALEERAHANGAGARELDQAIGAKSVLLVGRMDAGERYKGHDALLDVWPRVVAVIPDARLVFAGDGDDRARLVSKAAALGIGDRVIFPGFLPVDALDHLYNRAAVFAMPSRGEGFGLVYVEAMAHGLPCVGSIHDAAGEVIEDGVTGSLVDQSNGPALADVLTRWLSDESTRRRLGQAGRERVQRHFTYGQFSHRLTGLLQRSFGTDVAALPSASRVVD